MRVSFTQHPTLLDSDLETPVGLFIRLVGELQGILLESAEVDGRCRFSNTVKWFHRQRRRKFHPSMRTPHQPILEYGERILIFSQKR